MTCVGDCLSSLGFPSSGVPQGSVLDPTLFSAFSDDFPNVLPPDSTVCFADDTSIYIISDSLPSLNSSLQLCLNLANLRILKNGLTLNTLKSKCMLIHSSQNKIDGKLELFVDCLPIEQVRVLKFLGVLLNNTLTWSDHIARICTKVSCSLNLLRHLSWFLPKSFCSTSSTMLFQSLTIVMLCGPAVPMLKLTSHLSSPLPWNSFQLWLSSCSSQTSILLCLLCQTRTCFYSFKQQKEVTYVSDNVQVLELPISFVPVTPFCCTINPPQHTRFIHQSTKPPLDVFLLWQKSIQLCWCFGMAIPSKQCSSLQGLSYIL